MKNKKNNNRGVTLVEIAIVLVIIGLLLGGILKGQELISNSKIRSIADRQSGLKVAWYAFRNRFDGIPGDYAKAESNIEGGISGNGDGIVLLEDSPIAFQQLTAAGFLRCPQCTATAAELPSALNSLQNSYGGVMSIWNDGLFYMVQGGAGGKARLLIHTGPRIPSNIIKEVDQKIDDGIANVGDFTFNNYDSTTQPPAVAECTEGATNAVTEQVLWRSASRSPPVVQNCGASLPI